MKKYNYEERRDTYNAAFKRLGVIHQVYVAIEEMSEVTKALTKFLRDPAHIETAMPSIIEEVADATIMLEQIRLIFGVDDEVCEVMDRKIERLKERVGE